jgi:hypothetical protein
MKNKHCEWCDNQFKPAVSYQIYCSAECRQLATREKIAEKYNQIRRSRRIGKVRQCKSCGTNLSVYNDDQICNTCSINPIDVSKALRDIKGIANGKSE